MKKKKKRTVRIPKYNKKIIEMRKFETLSTYIYLSI